MSRRHTWTCRGCGTQWPRTKQKCMCGVYRPRRRKPPHQLVLEVPYELWVARFGDRCNVCGRPAGATRTLDRDHDHQTGDPRGLLCHRCNRVLSQGLGVTPDLLRLMIAYLEREPPEEPEPEPECPMCGWTRGSNPSSCGECARAA